MTTFAPNPTEVGHAPVAPKKGKSFNKHADELLLYCEQGLKVQTLSGFFMDFFSAAYPVKGGIFRIILVRLQKI